MKRLLLTICLCLVPSVAWAAFPQVESITETSFSTATTSHLVDLPPTVNAGELLLMFVAFRGQTSPPTPPTGWTEKAGDVQSGIVSGVYVLVADGTEGGGTADVVTDAAGQGAAQVYRISAWEGTLTGVENSAVAVFTSGTARSSPSLSPSWGSNDNLWITVANIGDDDGNVTGYPTNYTNGTQTLSGGGVNASASVATARRELAAGTEDPGDFTLDQTEIWLLYTIAIEPSAGGGGSSIAPILHHLNQQRRRQ